MIDVQKINKLINLNKKEIFLIFILIVSFCLMMLFFGNVVSCVLIDLGREAYFPEQVLQGKILYKDLFNIFGPLSYQINAVFYMIFGSNLSTLRLIGTINSLLILGLFYTISRFFTSKENSFIITLFIMITCIFNHSALNYIYAYSYAVIYSLVSLLFSVLFLILYLKTNKQIFIPLSWFFVGFSMASKYDYIFYAIFLLFFTVYAKFKKNLGIKYIIYSIFSFLSVPVICFSILFLQGLTLDELLYHSTVVKNFSLSSTANYFYHHYTGLYPDKNNLIRVLKTFIKVFGGFILSMSLIYFSLKSFMQKKYGKLSLFLFLTIITSLVYYKNTHLNTALNLSWITLFTFFVFCFLLKERFIDKKKIFGNDLYLLIIFIALITSSKSFFLLNFIPYGLFAFPLLFIVCSIFILEYLPKRFSIIDSELIKKSFIIFFLIFSLIVIYNFKKKHEYGQYVGSNKGVVYNTWKTEAETTQDAIKYTLDNFKEGGNIWVIPEGTMINFLTNHPSNGLYSNIMPPYIQAFGEEKIISDTEKSPPKYVFITNRVCSDHGLKDICVDYGIKICDYIKEKYSPVVIFETVVFKNAYQIFIYERKK